MWQCILCDTLGRVVGLFCQFWLRSRASGALVVRAGLPHPPLRISEEIGYSVSEQREQVPQHAVG